MRFWSILLFVFAGICAQAKTLQWYQAVVVLNDNRVLVGEVVIQPSLDVVLFRSGETRTFYPASKINYINVHNSDVNVPRKFISLIHQERGRSVAGLYEVVLQGELSVVRKSRKGELPDYHNTYGYEYFVMENSSLVKLSDFRKRVYPIIENYYSEKQMLKFLNDEKLNPWSMSDAIRLIDIYNERMPIDATPQASARSHSATTH